MQQNLDEWAYAPFKRCRDYIYEEGKLLSTCMTGMSVMTTLPDVHESISRVSLQISELFEGLGVRGDEEEDTKDSEPDHEEIELTKNMASFAKGELERGFPLLHAHVVVAIWGALETMVEDLMVA